MWEEELINKNWYRQMKDGYTFLCLVLPIIIEKNFSSFNFGLALCVELNKDQNIENYSNILNFGEILF